MRTVCFFIAALTCSAALGDDVKVLDEVALKVWRAATLQKAKLVRDHEDDLLSSRTNVDLDALNDIGMHAPQREVQTRLSGTNDAIVETIYDCSQAVIEFRWLFTDKTTSLDIRDSKVKKDVVQYVSDARQCEKDLKLTPHQSVLRSIADKFVAHE